MESSIAPFRSDARSSRPARPSVPGELTVAVLAVSSGLLYVMVVWAEQSLSGGGLAGGGWADPANQARFLSWLLVYAVCVLALLALYARVVALCASAPLSERAWWLAIVLPILFYIGLLFSSPVFSPDVYTYAAYGYIGNLSGGNAYYQEARTIMGTPFGMQLRTFGWTGSGLSPYGPIWNDLETAVVRVVPDALRAVLFGKAIVVAATLGSALLVFSILSSVRPAVRLAGTVAFLWNPLLVLLLAGEGHNDGLVVLLVLAALALTVQGRVAGGVVLQVMAVLTKYLPLVLLPVQVAFWWRTEPNRPHLALRLALATLLATGMAVLLYQPVWLGMETFMGTGLLGSGVSDESGLDLPSRLASFGRYAVLACAVLIGAWRARNPALLLSSCAGVILVVVLAGPQQFWPWYAALPITLMLLTPSRTFRWTSLVLAACSLLASPVDEFSMMGNVVLPEIQSLALHIPRVVPLLTFSILAGVAALSRTSGFDQRQSDLEGRTGVASLAQADLGAVLAHRQSSDRHP